jgi:transcription elongation factor Elf1
MSVFLDRKYLLLMSSRLDRFAEKKTDLFNFRCPVCGDSKKNKTKARGFVYRKENSYYYTCHNCGLSVIFGNMLKAVDSSLYQQYVLEKFTEPKQTVKKEPAKPIQLFGPKPENIIGKTTIYNLHLPRVRDLEESNPARKYVESRMIPKEKWEEIFYAEDFKKFMDETFPEHGKDLYENDPRLVLCYTNSSGEVTHVTGRTLGKSNLRYITIKLTEEKKVFNLHNIDVNKTVYIVEGQFDSMFLDNALASGDSNLSRVAKELRLKDFVLVFDNEPRNREINKLIGKAIDEDYPVVLFPEKIEQKDINDMILSGISIESLRKMIDDNTYAGLSAKLQHSVWKRV